MASVATVCPEWEGRLHKKEYRDWLSVGHALSIMCDGIRPFIAREIKTFHTSLCATLASKAPCHCTYTRTRKRNPWHDLSVCAWANELIKNHRRHKPIMIWQQSDSTKWTDPTAGPWEIAKLYMSDLGNHSVSVVDAHTTDPTGLLNLIYWCDYFKVQQPLVKEVRETRNTKWGHAPQQELSLAQKNDAFQAIRVLLQDPELVADPDVQSALAEIVSLEATELMDFEEIELKVIKDSLNSVNDKIEEMRFKIESSELKSSIHSIEIKREILDVKELIHYYNNRSVESSASPDSVDSGNPEIFKMKALLSTLEELVKGFEEYDSQDHPQVTNKHRRTSVLYMVNWLWKYWILIACLLSCFVVMDKEINSGCAGVQVDNHLQLKEFNFEDYLNSARSNFVGRHWLFRDLEDIVESKQEISGLLITGDPGSGKSALVSEMICSKLSSPKIHTRVIGFHFCSHSDKGTQSTAKFVRNIANMIAAKIEEYEYIILIDKFIQKILHIDCFQDPVGCFEQSILTPLKNINLKPPWNWYIIIDALDECLVDSAQDVSVVDLLRFKLSRFPKWLKVILTSRKDLRVTKYISGLDIYEIDPDNPRNREDIHLFVNQVMTSHVSRMPLIESLLYRPESSLAMALVNKSQGNFLYVKTVLSSTDVEVLHSSLLPQSLGSTYQIYFERKYPSGEGFQFVRKIFEVLVASFVPLPARELFDIITLEAKGLQFKYDFLPKLRELSIFLRQGKVEGQVSIYHFSLSEWLTSKDNEGGMFFIDKQNGHQLLAEHFLTRANHSKNDHFSPESTFYLATHIVEGGAQQRQINLFLALPSQYVNKSDSGTKLTALHHSASHGKSGVTSLLIKHFADIDIEDIEGKTPAFLAAATGNINNLDILTRNGADLEHFSAPLDKSFRVYSGNQEEDCKRTMCEYSLLHAAAQGGHTEVVSFLLDKKVNQSRETGSYYTALQLAAEHGHTATVKVLLMSGVVGDSLTLYQAASNGHADVVKEILIRGIKDTCRHFKGSKVNNINKENSRTLSPDETALHVAVRNGHTDVVQVLLNETDNAMNCTNAAGNFPLHEAVISNNVKTMRLLLRSGANPTTRCRFKIREKRHFIRVFEANHVRLPCRCGFTSLHWAAELQFFDIALELINFGIDVNAVDCNGSTALHFASCQDNPHFLRLLINSGRALINIRSLNGSTPLHSAGACYASRTFETLLKFGSDPSIMDNNRMTVFHYILKDVDFTPDLYFLDPYVDMPVQKVRFDLSKGSAPYAAMQNYKWYDAIISMCFKVPNIDLFLKGRDIFQFAGTRGLNNASVLLTQNPNLTNSIHVASVTPLLLVFDLVLRLYGQDMFELGSQSLSNDIAVKYALAKLISTVTTSLIDKNCTVLVQFFKARLIFTPLLLLESGFDINCWDTESQRNPLTTYLHVGGRHVSKVLVQYNARIEVVCGKDFEMSPLHLTAFHKLHYLHYLSRFYPGHNWEDYLQYKNAIFDYFFYEYKEESHQGETVIEEIGDGPFVKVIKNHPQGHRLLDKCTDSDGYTVLHRAAQGANVAAVKKLLSLGADVLQPTPHGHNALSLSVLYAVKHRLTGKNLGEQNVLTSLEIEFASMTAMTILNHMAAYHLVDVGCQIETLDLTLYHLAASRGMWKFIASMFRERLIVGMNANCANTHGITPMYLAMIYGGYSCDWDNPWCKVVNVIKEQGGVMSYPTREAEYNLIFNYLFRLLPGRFNIDLSDDELLSLRPNCGEKCSSSTHGTTEYLNLSDQIDSILRKYDEKLSSYCGCPPQNERLPELETAEPTLRCFSKTFNSLHIQFYAQRSRFVKFLEQTSNEIYEILVNATRKDEGWCEKRNDSASSSDVFRKPDDMCRSAEGSREVDIETASKHMYKVYKESLSVLIEESDRAKKFIDTHGTGKRDLFDVHNILYKHDAGLLCDWRSITTKYVRLRFLIYTLRFWRMGVHSISRIPQIPRFLAERIRIILLDPKSESLEFILNMALNKKSEDFNYLRTLHFRKPPLWDETPHWIK